MRGASSSIRSEVWPCGSLLDFVAVYLYRSHSWPWRGSDALPRGGGFRLIIRGGWWLYLLPDAVPWWVCQLHEGGGGLRNVDEGRKGVAVHPLPSVAWPCGSLLDVVAVYL